jgi:hypothetical protein
VSPTFLSEKSALLGDQTASFTERKKYLLNERPLLLERKCPFCSGKEKKDFRSACERHKIV